MKYYILFKRIHFVLSYSTQRWNACVAGNFFKIKKTGKMKHAYNKDKTCLIILPYLQRNFIFK